MKTYAPTRRPIIALAIILSLVMYFAGVFSGIYANKIIERKVGEDIAFLKSYMDLSSLDFKNMLLLQLLMDQMPDKCRSSEIYLTNLRNLLEPYWQKLPSRLESYEREGKITEEYKTLKREYIRLSLRIWIIARKNYKNCNSNIVPVLYFYNNDCKTCVRQGEIFDELKDEMKKIGKNLVVFPIDKDFDDDNVYLLKEYYNITSVPTAIIEDKVLTGETIPLNKLFELIKS